MSSCMQQYEDDNMSLKQEVHPRFDHFNNKIKVEIVVIMAFRKGF